MPSRLAAIIPRPCTTLKRETGITGGALSTTSPPRRPWVSPSSRIVSPKPSMGPGSTPVRLAPTAAEGILRAVFANIVAELERKGAVSGCPLNNLRAGTVASGPGTSRPRSTRSSCAGAASSPTNSALIWMRARRTTLHPDVMATLVVAASLIPARWRWRKPASAWIP